MVENNKLKKELQESKAIIEASTIRMEEAKKTLDDAEEERRILKGNNAQLKQIGTAMRSKFRAEEKKVKMMQQRLDEVEAQLKETERERDEERKLQEEKRKLQARKLDEEKHKLQAQVLSLMRQAKEIVEDRVKQIEVMQQEIGASQLEENMPDAKRIKIEPCV